MSIAAEDCARQILDAVPPLMHRIRTHMRDRHGPGLSVPEFRVLMFVHNSPGSSLSAVAESLGLGPPGTSKVVDHLVRRGLVLRRADAHDRRRVALVPTRRGQALRADAQKHTRSVLAGMLQKLPGPDRLRIAQAMEILRQVLASPADHRPISSAAARRSNP